MALAGCVRVRLLADSGHEVELYRVERGQTCILTTSCLLAGAAYSAEGIVEQEVAALSIPRPAFEALTAESPVFRRFVFQAFGQRLADLMLLVNEIAFRRVDRRIAQWLDRSAGPGGALPVTHQRIADELGTAREVVSRQLKEFERRGWLRLGRGSIEIGDRAALAAFGRDAD